MVPRCFPAAAAVLQLHGQREAVSHGQHAQGDAGVAVQLFVQLVDGHGVPVVGGGVEHAPAPQHLQGGGGGGEGVRGVGAAPGEFNL